MKFPFSRTISNWYKYHTYKTDDWKFSDERRMFYIREYDEWLQFYLPIPLKGLTVLDEGAGEGESARFFLEHGARKVICVEPDAVAFKNLLINSKERPMVCMNRRFDLSDLKFDFDFMKMDIEGFEEAMLSVSDFDKPCVIEYHGLQLREAFERSGYIIRNKATPPYTIGYAYKNLGDVKP